MNNPLKLPVTTETELRQKIELQNKKISLKNKEISSLLQSMRQKREERRQKGEQREQMLSLSVSRMQESIAKAKNSNIFNPRDTTGLK
jgi:hypothetical protein